MRSLPVAWHANCPVRLFCLGWRTAENRREIFPRLRMRQARMAALEGAMGESRTARHGRFWPTAVCWAVVVESTLATPAARERLMRESVTVAESGDRSRFNS
jgi:hypothetical protein